MTAAGSECLLCKCVFKPVFPLFLALAVVVSLNHFSMIDFVDVNHVCLVAAATAGHSGLPALSAVSSLEKLPSRHGVKLCPPFGVSVEECGLAVGEIAGYRSMRSASFFR